MEIFIIMIFATVIKKMSKQLMEYILSFIIEIYKES